MESAEGGYLSDSLDEKEGLNGVAAAGVTLHSLWQPHLSKCAFDSGKWCVCGIKAGCRDGGLIIMHNYCGNDENLLVYIKTQKTLL